MKCLLECRLILQTISKFKVTILTRDQLFKNIEKAELIIPKNISESGADVLRKVCNIY